MKKFQALIVSVLAIAMATPASAGVNDPEVIIYRFPGVRDDGGVTFVGIATVFSCTNFSGAIETVRFVTRDAGTSIKTNTPFSVSHLDTLTAPTHRVALYDAVLSNLSTGSVVAGTTAIAATSTNIICTAMLIDAANVKPDGVALRGIRFNPAPGSQE